MNHHNQSLADNHWVESLHTYVKPDWNDLVSGEFATKVINGTWSLEAMRGWILQLYPFIHAFPKFLAEALIKVEDEYSRAFLIDNIRVEKAHADHWLWMGEGFGIPRKDMMALATGERALLRDVQSLSDWIWYINAKGSLEEAVAATSFAIEGATGDLSRALLEPGQPRQMLTLTAELGTLEFHHDVGACLRRLATAADLAAGEPDAVAVLAPFADAALAAEDSDAAAAFCRAVAALATSHAPDRAALLRLAAQAMLSGQALTPGSASGVYQAIRRLHNGPDDIPARQLLSGMALGAAARGRNPRRTVALALRSVGGGPVRFMEPLPSTTACAALALAWAGDLSAASDACAQAIEASRRITSRTGEALALFVRSEIAYQRGSLNTALADAQQAIRLFQMVGATGLRAVAVAHSTRVLLMRGELGAVSAQPADCGHESSGHPFVLGIQQEARGMIAAAQANRALALRLYLECGRHLMAGGLVNPACSAWRSRAVAVLIGLGRKPEARALGENEVTLARAWGAPGPLGRALVGYASAHEGTARLDLLGEAVSVLEDSDCRLNLARALVRLGTEMYAAGHSRAARDVLERGLDMSSECGAATLTAVAHRAMHAAGARPRGQSASVTLTAAERRVADLVISGMSNQAVATTLTLSKRTVDTHLGRIYRKLGITGRTRLREAIAGPDR